MSAALKTLPLVPFELEIIRGPHSGQKLSFEKASITIGRGAENQVILSQDLRVSRKHAEIKQSDGVFSIVNISQKNYILSDGVKVEYQQLIGQPILTIGESEIRFRILENAAAKTGPAKALVPLANPPGMTPAMMIQTNSPSPVVLRPAAPTPAPMGPPPMARVRLPKPPPSSLGRQNFENGARPKKFEGPSGGSDDGRTKFYVILGVIGVAVYFFLSGPAPTKKKEQPIRNSAIIENEMNESQERIEKLEERIAKQGNVTNRRAEENFIKGFRDYQKGQYLRAKEYFRIVLNLSPDHIEARKYFEQSNIKLRKLIEFNFIEGLKSKEKKNYRMCKSFFSHVLILSQGDRTSYDKYDEAEKFLRECNLGLEGRF